LESGWNPFINGSNTSELTLFTEAVNKYLLFKSKELKPNSLRGYKSYIKRIIDYVEKKYPNLFSVNFNKKITLDFMTSLRLGQNISNQIFNNNLLFYRIMFNWLVEYNYADVNYFNEIKPIPKKKLKKIRRPFEQNELIKLVDYLTKENKRYLCMCLLCYYCLLRPEDIVNLKKSSFDLKRHLIFISEDYTKNDKNSYRVIPKVLDKYLTVLELSKMNNTDFVFSTTKTFLPGKKKLDSREVARYWANHVRPFCKFGIDLQFYSLKDTGITNLMSNGISSIYGQGQADHSSLEITEKYAHNKTPAGFNQLRNLARDVKEIIQI
jgi:integrase